MDRIAHELALVEKRFGRLTTNEKHDWFIVEEFVLPPGLYNRSSTRVLVFLTAVYPQAAPDNFLVPEGLRMASGDLLAGDYREKQNQKHFEMDWGVFSWHQKQWRPAPEIAQGDNLLTFMFTVQRRLRER